MNKKKAERLIILGLLLWAGSSVAGAFAGTVAAPLLTGLVAVAWVVGIFGAVFLYRAVTWQVAVDSFEAGSIGLSWLIAAGGAVLVARTPAEAAVLAGVAAIGGLLVGLGLIDQS